MVNTDFTLHKTNVCVLPPLILALMRLVRCGRVVMPVMVRVMMVAPVLVAVMAVMVPVAMVPMIIMPVVMVPVVVACRGDWL